MIANTFFPQSPESRWTHTSSSGRKRTIDYILVSKNLWALVRDAGSSLQLDLGSDHKAVQATLDLDVRTRQRRQKRRSTSWKPIDKRAYDAALDARLTSLTCTSPVDVQGEVGNVTKMLEERCAQIEAVVKDIAADHESAQARANEDRAADKAKLQELLASRRQARQRGESVRDLSKQIQHEIRAVGRARRRAQIATILSEFKGLKSLLQAGKLKSRDRISSMKDEHGDIQTDQKAVVEVFASFYENLYGCKEVLRRAVQDHRERGGDLPPFTMEELENELKGLKGGKCRDTAGLVAEMLKDGPQALKSAMLHVYNALLCTNARPPSTWCQSVISVLFKDGDQQEVKNYRPISIISLLYKVFSRLLLGRVKPILEQAQATDQAGFRAGFGCSDHLFTLTQLQEKAYEWRQDLWICAVDFVKAFDTVYHAELLSALRAQGLPVPYVELIEALYADCTAQVKTDCKSRTFAVQRGVRQGDPLSPVLFNAALEEVMRACKDKWRREQLGLSVVTGGDRLTNLRFADDLLLIATSLQDLERMIGDLALYGSEFGLQMHPQKTKILSNVPDNRRRSVPTQVTVGPLNIEVVGFKGYTKYLGRRFSFHNAHGLEVEHRISNAWKKFFAYKHVLCNRRFAMSDRLKLFNANVTPSVLYGCESWCLTAELEHKLRKAQRQMLRSIFQAGRRRRIVQAPASADGASPASSSSTSSSSTTGGVDLDTVEILEPWVEWLQRVTREVEGWNDQLGIKPWLELVRRRKHQWAGHIARREDGRWSLLVLDWLPEGGPGRRHARPRRRWEDDLLQHVQLVAGSDEMHWRFVVGDRQYWKGMEDDFATGQWRG